MNKKKIILPIVMLLLLIVVTVGVTFAAFTFSKEGTVENVIESSTIMLTYTEGKTGIILNEAYPMSDETGKMLTGTNNVFDFTVTATLGKSNVISYEVSAIKIPITDMTPLEDNEVKLYLERAIDPDATYHEVLSPSNFLPIENQTEVGSPIGSMILDSGIFMEEGTTIHNYRLKMWIDESANIPNGESRKYGVKINVYAKQLQYDSIDESCFTFDESTGTITAYDINCPKNVIVPNTLHGLKVTSIGNSAFGLKQLNSVIIQNGITSIGMSSFVSNQLTFLSIPKSVVKIGVHAFLNNQLPDNQAFIYNRNTDGSINYTSLNSYGGAKRDNVIIPDGVVTIEEGAFRNNKVENVTIPNSVVTIGKEAFYMEPLTSITIPNSVTTIGDYAFSNNQLMNLTIPNNVKTIGKFSFSNNKLENLTIEKGITTIGRGAFRGNILIRVTIPSSVLNIGDDAFYSNQLVNVTIEEGVQSIGNSAFYGNKLTNILIPESITTIGASAFSYNQLTSVTIPKNVIEIGSNAFEKYSGTSNIKLNTIINKTGRSFDWQDITHGSAAATFVTGTVPNSYGDIIVTDN